MGLEGELTCYSLPRMAGTGQGRVKGRVQATGTGSVENINDNKAIAFLKPAILDNLSHKIP